MSLFRRLLALGVVASLLAGAARGQSAASLADELIVISAGERAKETAREGSPLGPAHGTAEAPFSRIAGADEDRLGPKPFVSKPIDVLTAASRPDRLTAPVDRRPGITPPALPEPTAAAVPLYGPLELPAVEDEGPEDGLTLDQAIDAVVHANPELAVKFQELPKADADVITAGLWGNPLIFASADAVPYGSYTKERPGSNNYGITIVQPLDVNGKLRARTRLAQSVRSVLQAQYQDAVRLELEKLHLAWVDALNTRTTVQYLRTNHDGYATLLATIQDQVSKEAAAESDLDAAVIQQETARVAFEEAATRHRLAKRALMMLWGVPAVRADAIELRGSIRDQSPPPPPTEELVGLALQQRPDLIANRLGVRSATANVAVQKRERFPDVFMMYTPYSFNANNDDSNARSVTSWGMGIFATVPLFNRNQGNVYRAERNLHQTRLEASGLERQVQAEVEAAALEYESSRAAVERFERSILPRAKHLRDDKHRLYAAGEEGLPGYLLAQRDYNETIRVYRDVLIRHRRGMLALNTAVGQRILP